MYCNMYVGEVINCQKEEKKKKREKKYLIRCTGISVTHK